MAVSSSPFAQDSQPPATTNTGNNERRSTQQQQNSQQSNPVGIARNGQSSQQHNDQRQQNRATNKFMGATESMKNDVLEMGGGAGQFPKTIEALRLYASTQYSGTPEILCLFEDNPVAPVIIPPAPAPTPTGPEGTLTPFDEAFHTEAVKAYFKDTRALTGNMKAFFSIIFGQCDQQLKAHLESKPDFATNRRNGDCLWLLCEIRIVVSKFDNDHWVHDSLHPPRELEYYRIFLSVQGALNRP
jgi:hypothetical protein